MKKFIACMFITGLVLVFTSFNGLEAQTRRVTTVTVQHPRHRVHHPRHHVVHHPRRVVVHHPRPVHRTTTKVIIKK